MTAEEGRPERRRVPMVDIGCPGTATPVSGRVSAVGGVVVSGRASGVTGVLHVHPQAGDGSDDGDTDGQE